MNPLQRAWYRRRLRDPAYLHLFDAPPPNEWVSIDCETTGLDRERDDIISIGAVRICGQRILCSERLDLMVQPDTARAPMGADSVRIHQLREADLSTHGLPPLEVARRVLAFIGPRPLVGYYLEFDVAMLNRLLKPVLGIPLPNPLVEVSGMYYDLKYAQQPDSHIDLRLNTLMTDLALPRRHAHNAVNDATMAALAFVKLKALLNR